MRQNFIFTGGFLNAFSGSKPPLLCLWRGFKLVEGFLKLV